MKVLIVNPPACRGIPYIREGRCMQIQSSWAALWMPLSLAYVAAVLRADGHEIRLVDAIADCLTLEQLLALRDTFDPGLVILNTGYPSIEGDRATALALKNRGPATHVCIMGMFPTLLEGQALEYVAGADSAIVGEPEWTARRLAAALENRLSLDTVRGLVFRSDGALRVNPPQTFSEQALDDLPFPARDLLPNDAYRLPLWGRRFTLLSIGRGCPHPCIFCAAPAYYGRSFRKRSVPRVGDEIQECVTRHRIRHFLFWGESFTADPDYGEALCDEIIARKLPVAWSATSRVDTLHPALLAKMKKAGCVLLGLGIESACQDILDLARKGIRVDQITEAIRMARLAGIKTMGHFLFGLPGETASTARETIRFALRSGLTYAQFYVAVPYPKTALGAMATARGWIHNNAYPGYDLTSSIMRNEALSCREINALRSQAFRRFYFRPRMLGQILREAGSLRSLCASFDFLKWIRKRG